jgi:hypothetical protein
MFHNSNLWPDSKWSTFHLPLQTFRLSLFLFLFGFVSGNLFPTFFSQSFSSFSVLVSFECIDILQILQRKYHLFASLTGFGGLANGQRPTQGNAGSAGGKSNGNQRQIRPFFAEGLRFEGLQRTQKSRSRNRWSTVRSFKIGILFGFFVDAFKVGS